MLRRFLQEDFQHVLARRLTHSPPHSKLATAQCCCPASDRSEYRDARSFRTSHSGCYIDSACPRKRYPPGSRRVVQSLNHCSTALVRKINQHIHAEDHVEATHVGAVDKVHRHKRNQVAHARLHHELIANFGERRLNLLRRQLSQRASRVHSTFRMLQCTTADVGRENVQLPAIANSSASDSVMATEYGSSLWNIRRTICAVPADSPRTSSHASREESCAPAVRKYADSGRTRSPA